MGDLVEFRESRKKEAKYNEVNKAVALWGQNADSNLEKKRLGGEVYDQSTKIQESSE